MLPRTQRITTRLFTDIVQKGSAFHAPLFSIRVKKAQNKSRFGVSVPKKVTKTAVLRNKIRRRIYSSLIGMKLQNHFEVVFVAKTGIEKLKQSEIKQEIEKIFVKSGLLK